MPMIRIDHTIINTDHISIIAYDPKAREPYAPVIIHTQAGRSYAFKDSQAEKLWAYFCGEAIDLLAEEDLEL